MQITVRGNVQVPIQVENLGDVLNVLRGFFRPELVRRKEIPQALIAPATSCFALPAAVVVELKLQRRGTCKAKTVDGHAFFGVYEPVRLIVQDRECSVDVVKVPDGCPALIGSIPLKLLDLALDPEGRLIGNPAHQGHPMVDLA